MEIKSPIIIIGGSHHNTLGVIRSLGRKDIRPIVVLTNKGGENILQSKYVSRGFMVDGSEAAIELIEKEFAGSSSKPVIIACHDVISSILDLNYTKLSPYFILPGCEKQGAITQLMNKKLMGEKAVDNGLIAPKTFLLNNNSIKNCEAIPYPCITKPVESRNGKKSQIHIIEDKKQLELFLDNESGKDFLVQQFIKKDFEFQLIGCSLQSGNDIIIPGVSIILRQPSTTNTGFLHYKPLDSSFKNTVDKCKSFIRSIGYSGLFSVEFLRDKQGVDYFMEINYRNDGNSIAVTNAGVNLPYIWFLASTGQDYQSELQPIHEEYVMPEFAELELLAKGAITIKQWKEDMKKATSYMDYAPDDWAPTNGWKNYTQLKRKALLKNIINNLLRRK